MGPNYEASVKGDPSPRFFAFALRQCSYFVARRFLQFSRQRIYVTNLKGQSVFHGLEELFRFVGAPPFRSNAAPLACCATIRFHPSATRLWARKIISSGCVRVWLGIRSISQNVGASVQIRRYRAPTEDSNNFGNRGLAWSSPVLRSFGSL